MLLDLLAAVVLVFVGTRIVGAVRVSLGPILRDRIRAIVSGLRPVHFLRAVVVLFVIATVSFELLKVPGLDFGWWTAIGGTGNPVTGGTERTAETPLHWIIPLLFLTLLLPALPLFAAREEQMFRAGDENRTFWQRARRGMLFGLAHLLIGIPIGVGLALAIGGWFFTWRYLVGYRRGGRDAALMESTRSHLAYNAVIVVLGLVAVATGQV